MRFVVTEMGDYWKRFSIEAKSEGEAIDIVRYEGRGELVAEDTEVIQWEAELEEEVY